MPAQLLTLRNKEGVINMAKPKRSGYHQTTVSRPPIPSSRFNKSPMKLPPLPMKQMR